MSSSRSFREYVEKRFDNELFNEINTYLIHNRNNLHVNLYNVEYVDYVELQEVTVKQVYVNDLPGADIAFDILAEADFTVCQYSNRYGEKEEDATKWFKFSCKGNLENNLDDCIVKNPEEYLSKPQPSKPLDDSLVPYIHKEEYDTVAAEFLKAANCERCITSAVPVDAMKIASALGLNVKSVNLSRDRSIFGRIYFCDDEVEIYNDSDEPETITVKGKTILVDPLANYLKTLGQLDNTIIHECFHWYKHKKVYELERLYNKDATSIGCLVVGGVQGDTRKATEWMERQANAITPRIQMPIAGFKRHVSDLIAKYKAMGMDYLDSMDPIIREISTDYNVSLTAAKIRMIDAGFHDAAGTLNYIDERYVAPHSWKKGAIERNQTFSIGEIDATLQSFFNLGLREKVESGKYEYIDAHFILRSPLYIAVDEKGNHVLTDYARYNMDECALVFDLSLKNGNAYGESYHTECFLNKDEHSPFEFSYEFHGELPNSAHDDPTGAVGDYIMKASQIADDFTKDFSKCMQSCRKFMDLTYAEIARRVDNVTQTQIERIFRGESQGTFESIVAIIFAMELPSVLNIALMERSPHPFISSKPDHLAVRTAMYILASRNIEDVREYLRKRKVYI